MKKYFLLTTTALLLGANVVNAEQPIMDNGRINMQARAQIEDLGVRIDEDFGLQHLDFGKVIIDKSKIPDELSSPEDVWLGYLNPETGNYDEVGEAFVGTHEERRLGKFALNGVPNQVQVSLEYVNSIELYNHEVIPLYCDNSSEVYVEPEYRVEYDRDNEHAIVSVGGNLYGYLGDDVTYTYCDGAIEIMLEVGVPPT